MFTNANTVKFDDKEVAQIMLDNIVIWSKQPVIQTKKARYIEFEDALNGMNIIEQDENLAQYETELGQNSFTLCCTGNSSLVYPYISIYDNEEAPIYNEQLAWGMDENMFYTPGNAIQIPEEAFEIANYCLRFTITGDSEYKESEGYIYIKKNK